MFFLYISLFRHGRVLHYGRITNKFFTESSNATTWTDICTAMRRYAQICTDIYRHAQICSDTNRYTRIYIRMCTKICSEHALCNDVLSISKYFSFRFSESFEWVRRTHSRAASCACDASQKKRIGGASVCARFWSLLFGRTFSAFSEGSLSADTKERE